MFSGNGPKPPGLSPFNSSLHHLPEEHIMARQQYTPTPTEIRRECERIRSEWSEDTLWKRSGLEHCRHWMPPTVHMPRTHELIETITDP
ncbi:MAG TPA: hypothetical protein DCE47_23770 [Planctomycetaceae bacterium]|nr:hypothetical protein [Planctomycetaceae bacterium]HCC99327.1 hypothetical protein [Planctomycetaceae bacterium]|tara:strand:- start:473 stop:739 length:267 start_codon:yes stop_codon:yes gene_type:complete